MEEKMANKDDHAINKFVGFFCGLCAVACICWGYEQLEFFYLVLFILFFYFLVKFFEYNQKIKKAEKEGAEDSAEK